MEEDTTICQEQYTNTTLESLNSLLDVLQHPENLLQTLLSQHPDKNSAVSVKDVLRTISKSLFSTLEQLATLQDGLSTESQNEAPLSGLSQLLVGSSAKDGSDSDDEVDEGIDAETIWGQVDLQNNALVTKLSGNVRYLKKKMKNGQENKQDLASIICLLNNVTSDSESDADEETEIDLNSDGEHSEHNSEDDTDARKIRERMEKAMTDMDNFSSDDGDEVSFTKSNVTSGTRKEEEYYSEEDPAREEMNDGFFDLHEMEKFADEEEEMLPEEAFGKMVDDNEDELNKKRQKSLPHIIGRELEEDISDEDNENELGISTPSTRRRRYRDDEDINALEALYNGLGDKCQNIADLTAEDFFGPPKEPSKKYLQLQKKRETDTKITFSNKDDADSWDEHDFTSDGQHWRDEIAEDKQESAKSDEEKEDTEDAEDLNSNATNTDKVSNFASHTQKLQQLTKKFEEELLAEKPWHMLGEAKGTQRPADSLLEGTPQFEGASKIAPIITVEHTQSIEEMIKSRILAEDWDDVIPRELPDIGMKQNGELPEVSQEKSKLSLGELYEREYLKKVTGYDKDAEEKQSAEEKAKGEMKSLFANLCSKLDALSNYHFTPRPVCDEVDVKTSATPAIAMEEILPLHVSDAKALAPEEIYASKKGRDGVIRGESEKSQSDRQRERQSKKAARRKARRSKLADEKLISKLQPGLGLNNPYEKRKMREELQMARASGKVITGNENNDIDFKTSTGFFEKLNQESLDKSNDDNRSTKRRRTTGNNTLKSTSYKL